MPYLGKTPSQATRQRYYLTASGGETSISGTMTTGGTLTFNDGEFVDVSVNGVALVAGTDYNTTTANTIGGLSALTASDQVEIIVYDTFSVFGGNVDGDFNLNNGTMTLTRDDNEPQLIIKSTDADATFGPEIELFRDSASPADQDAVGQIQFKGKNDAAETILYGEIDAFIRDASDGTEDGEVRINVMRDGTSREAVMFGQATVVFNEGGQDINFRVESNNQSSMFFVDGGNDRIGIGDGSPSDVLDIGIAGNINISDGNLKVASGHGIDFSATANAGNGSMDSELFDDYEEGTFTPTFTTNSGSAASAATVLGRYTKIGRMVYVTVHLTDIDTTGTTSSSSFRVDGLPFTVDQAGMSAPLVTHGFTFEGGRTYAVGFFSASEFISFLQMGSGLSDTNIDHSHIADDTADIICAGFYFTDQ